MKMDREDMEGRYIELAMDEVRVTFDKDAGGELCLKMQGVPYRTSDQELKDFFRPQAKCLDVKVILNKEGVPSGDAIATFGSEEEVQAAMACDRKELGVRYVTLQRAEKNGFPSSPPARGGRGDRGGFGGDRGFGGRGSRDDRRDHRGGRDSNSGYAVKLHGLPFQATEQDIVEFFKPVAHCTNVRILQNRNGLASGDAIASFAAMEDVDAAMTKNRQYIGSRYVTLT